MGNKAPAKSSILRKLAQQVDEAAKLDIDGQAVDSAQIKDALTSAGTVLSISPMAIIQWVLFSVILTPVLTVLFKSLGMFVSGEIRPSEIAHELLLRGDLLLISSCFALEAVGELLAAEAPGKVRVLVGFPCVLGLVASMVLISGAAFLPTDVHITTDNTVQYATGRLTTHEVASISVIANLLTVGCIPVFVTTMAGVLLAKLFVGKS